MGILKIFKYSSIRVNDIFGLNIVGHSVEFLTPFIMASLIIFKYSSIRVNDDNYEGMRETFVEEDKKENTICTVVKCKKD
jgi:hypothetical protein